MHGIVLIEVDPDAGFVDVVIGIPPDQARLVLFPIGVKIGEPHGKVGQGWLGAFQHGIAVGALVRRYDVIEDVGERAIEVTVVRIARLERRFEAILDAAGADRNVQAASRQFPAVGDILSLGQARHTHFGIRAIQEGERDLSAIRSRLAGRAHAPAEHDDQILRVKLRRGEAGRQQADGLLRETLLDIAREKVFCAVERRRTRALRSGV